MSNSNDTALIALVVTRMRGFRKAVWARVEQAGEQMIAFTARVEEAGRVLAERVGAVENRAAKVEIAAERLEGVTASNTSAVKNLREAHDHHEEAVTSLVERVAIVSKEVGPIGPMPQHEWDETRLRFERAQGVWGEYVELQGTDGAAGLMPKHQWNGTQLRFQLSPGNWGPWVDLRGEPGLSGGGGGGRRSSGGAVSPGSLANLQAFAAANG